MLFLKNFDNNFDMFDEFGRMYGKSNFMACDLVERDNEYELSVSLPGVDKKDINLDVNNGYLTISVSENEEKKDENKNKHYIVHERVSRSASRSFYVGDVAHEQVKAKLNDGILTVVVPKEPKQEKKYISIE